MGNEWPVSRLEDLTELIVDCPHSTPKWRDKGEVVLRSQNIRNGRLDLTSTSYTDHDGYLSRVKRAVPQADDLVLTREAPMGEVCMIPHGLKCCMGQRMVLIRTKRDLLSPHYLLYLIQSPFLQHQVSWNEGTGTTVSNIRIPNIKAFEILLPPLSEQKAIAHILGTLDDKIELNRRMNATLEGMAQALFKSWFVDFDPVIDNAIKAGNPIPEELSARAKVRCQAIANGTANREAAKAFPAAFEFSEDFGWIPNGWNVEPLGGVTKELRRGISPKYTEEEGVRVINQRCIRDHAINYSNARRNDTERKRVDGRLLQVGDLLINSTGVGTLGRMAQIQTLEEPTTIDSHVTVARPDLDYWKPHTFGRMMISIEAQVEAMGHGSTGQTELSRADLSVLSVVVSPKSNQILAEKFLSEWSKKTEKNSVQNKVLNKLRGTLLPQLISGELRIPANKKHKKQALS